MILVFLVAAPFLLWPLLAFKTWTRRIGGFVIWLGVLYAMSSRPALFTPFVIRAQYTAEGIPAIDTMRANTERCRSHGGCSPGLGRRADGTVARGEVDGVGTIASTALDDAVESLAWRGLEAVWQTFAATNGASSVTEWLPAMRRTDGCVTILTHAAAISNHFAQCLYPGPAELVGNRVSPNHFIYGALEADANRWLTVWGCFGDGCGLRTGTGYAVLEVKGGTAGDTMVATWEHYDSEGDSQIIPRFVHLSELPPTGAPGNKAERTARQCLVPLELLSTDPERSKVAVATLRQLGWK